MWGKRISSGRVAASLAIVLSALVLLPGGLRARQRGGDSLRVTVNPFQALHLALQLDVASSWMSGESNVFSMDRTTRLPLTTVGLLIWRDWGPETVYLSTGLKYAQYQQISRNGYQDRLSVTWGYFGGGLMLGFSPYVQCYLEVNGLLYLGQTYRVFARDAAGREWVQATPLGIFRRLSWMNNLGMRFRIGEWWAGAYMQILPGQPARRPNVLNVSKISIQQLGVTLWIPLVHPVF